jgi:hypothetical protein
MQTPAGSGSQDLARLVAACDAAMARVAAKDGNGFAELGEALFWLYALAEATGQDKDGRFRGLAWARNKIGHGVLVTAPIKLRIFGSEPGNGRPGSIDASRGLSARQVAARQRDHARVTQSTDA